jgi:parallel beta-helix repeat protein
VDSCAYNGIWVYPTAANNLTLKNSKLLNNGQYGLYVQDPAKLSLLSNCDISRNGYSGVYVQNNSVPLSVIGNTISNNAGHGLYVISRNDAQDTLLLIAGNKVRNNTLAGIYSSRAHVVDDSITGNRYAIGVVGQLSLTATTTANGNVYSGNIISGNTYEGTLLTEEAIFGKLGYSYPPGYSSKVIGVRGTAFVAGGTTLTIAPGSILKFPREYTGGAGGGDGRFRSDGILLSEGSTTSKIVFTSWKDDSYGGDTNLDSNATVPGNGNWDMIYLNGAGNNTSHILNTIIRFGGLSGNGNIYQVSNSAAIDSSFISYTANYAITLSNSSPNINANEIHHTLYGIYPSGSSNPVIYRNNFHDNTSYALYNGTTNTINAASNYWGAANGPLKTTGPSTGPTRSNIAGQGNRIVIASSGEVTWDPWLTTRSGILLGDVSENGTISAYDGALVLRHVVNIDTLKPSQQLAADVSADGTISAFDASYILRYVVGLVSGFPGLGKRSSEDLTSAYEFQLRAGSQNDQVELVLHLKGTAKIYSSEIHLTFDESRLTPVSATKMSLSNDMSVESNFANGSVHIAVAGTTPSESDGDFVRIVFRSSRQFRRLAESSIKITGFLLNEANLTSALSGNIAGSFNAIPTEFGLEQNYPNPFNPATTIEYQLPQPSSVSIIIYNVLGQEVRHLVSKDQAAGFYSISWDGKNSGGESVGTGMYLYRIRATAGGTDFTTVRKMLLLK